jgi:5-methylcytosine-specific restriction endonuclease McrA
MVKRAACGTIGGYKKHIRDKTKWCDSCKAAKSAQNKAYYEKNKKAVLARTTIYRLENREQINSNRKDAWKRYKPRHDAYVKENSEAIGERYKLYYQKNKDRLAVAKSEWRKNNPDKVRSIRRGAQNRRRASIVGNGFEKYTEQDVLGLYGTNCYICEQPIDLNANRSVGKDGWKNSLHIDHFIPISKGGSDTLNNVRPTHGKCNLIKGDKIISSAQSQAVNKR